MPEMSPPQSTYVHNSTIFFFKPINTTSDATFLSVLCENPKTVLLAKSWGAVAPPQPPPGITPLYVYGIVNNMEIPTRQM